jgi:dipeptidase E
MHIVAIGGGSIENRETFSIDEYIVGLIGKPVPRALFIPTASGDDPKYCQQFAEIYGGELGCQTENLLLSADDTPDCIRRKISEADLIYVGGGYTARMLKVWRKQGVDELLEAAHRKGTLLAGISAGGICWHDWGHSNSYASSVHAASRYQRIRGLGLRAGTFCPHLDEEQRHQSFVDQIRRCGGLGIACDDRAAIHYSANQPARTLSAHPGAGVTLYRRHGGEMCQQRFGEGELLDLPKSRGVGEHRIRD